MLHEHGKVQYEPCDQVSVGQLHTRIRYAFCEFGYQLVETILKIVHHGWKHSYSMANHYLYGRKGHSRQYNLVGMHWHDRLL